MGPYYFILFGQFIVDRRVSLIWCPRDLVLIRFIYVGQVVEARSSLKMQTDSAPRSELWLGLLEVLDLPEAIVAGILDDFLALPVGCDDGSIADAHSRHLEGKQVHVWLVGCLPHRIIRCVENRAVFEEATREAAKDHDLVLGDLDDTSALPLSKLCGGDVDDDPGVGAILGVVPLNRVAVLLT